MNRDATRRTAPQSLHENAREAPLVYANSRLEKSRVVHQQQMEKGLALFACSFQGICCLTALALFCFQGFHTNGFQLDTGLMNWIGAISIGNIASLTAIVYKANFRTSRAQ